MIDYGFEGRWNWLISGAISGFASSLAFGGVLLWVDPVIVAEGIPAYYGLDPASSTGWGLHMFHGTLLGVIFGYCVTRDPVLGFLTAENGGFITDSGPTMQFALSGVIYGFTVWVLLPALLLPLWVAITGIPNPGFPAFALESLLGHLIFGGVLGFLFSNSINISTDED